MSRLHDGIHFAIEQVPESGDLSLVSSDVRTVVLVHAAQGLIDNGGLQYFFESDFPKCPPYAAFIDAYSAIGADDVAIQLQRAVALFPFRDPHRSIVERNKFMNSFKDEDGKPFNCPFEELANTLGGELDVWKHLEEFMEERGASFGFV